MPLVNAQFWMRPPRAATYHYFGTAGEAPVVDVSSPCGKLLTPNHTADAGDNLRPRICSKCRRWLQARSLQKVLTRPAPAVTRPAGPLFAQQQQGGAR